MTITPATLPTVTEPAAPRRLPADRATVEAAAEMVLLAMAEADLDAGRWAGAGPLVTAAAEQLRRAAGVAVSARCTSVPPVVREADFARSLRCLLGTPDVADTDAGREFLRLAYEAALALA